MFASPWADAPCRPQDVGRCIQQIVGHNNNVFLLQITMFLKNT